MTKWVEVRAGLKRSGPVRLVPVETLEQHTGFRSVFCFDDHTAELIIGSGSTRGMRYLSVYADTLLMDFDGRLSEYFEQFLKTHNIAYRLYDSGNRSDHYHIPLEPIEGFDVPARCKAWVKANAPTADLSFYHPAGMYRLPGTFHPKRPGAQKELVRAVEGKPLALPEAPMAVVPVPRYTEDVAAKQAFIELMTKPFNPAVGRRPHIYLMSVYGAEAGLEFGEVLDAAMWWNSNFSPVPHEAAAVEAQVRGAFKTAQRM